MTGYPPPPPCWRCGAPADVDWCEITAMGDTKPSFIPGRMDCVTPGCVDEHGSTATYPPPEPAELMAQANRSWLELQTQLTKEQS